ncbi:MAG: glycosyltransferase family 4 protein, partial [Actinomycetota bacterium]|nr:glycosyltransferase family 4 protein [Actinomycetota bacterium]
MPEDRVATDAPRRVALVVGPSTGGIGGHVRSVAAGLASAGWEVVVCGPPATEERFGFTGVGATFRPVAISTGTRPDRDVFAVRALRHAVADADVLHAHGLKAAAVAGAVRGRRPLVVTWHNAVLGSGLRRTGTGALERWVARRATVTLGASSDLVERARSLGARDARLGPVAAPRLPAPARSREQVRAALEAGERPVVLAAARLAPQKRHDVLLEASRAWMRRDPAPLVVVAGDGPLRASLERRIHVEGLPVRLLGHREDVADLLAAADVVVLTSDWEARALVAQEALRAGVPLVATAVGGVPELVGDAAELVRPGRPAA